MSKFRFTGSSSMKSIVYASILALALLSFPTQHLTAAAQTGGPSANGSLKFSAEDGLTKTIEFKAVKNSDGSATGEMTFSGAVEIPDQDVDGSGDKSFSGKLENLYIEAKFDSMVVDRNRAVMSGVITGCTLGDYIGQRVLLTVEDNGDSIDPKAGDKFTLGVYKMVEKGWIPTDAELRQDDGARLTWIATDAERKDDQGVPYPKKNEVASTQSFPLSSYSFDDVTYGDGNIQVLP